MVAPHPRCALSKEEEEDTGHLSVMGSSGACQMRWWVCSCLKEEEKQPTVLLIWLAAVSYYKLHSLTMAC